MIEVLIYSGYGGSEHGHNAMNEIEKQNPFPANRVLLAKYVKEHCVEVDGVFNSLQIQQYLEAHKQDIIRVQYGLRYMYFVLHEGLYPVGMSIEKVDTSKKWTIDSDGSNESIEYIDYKCLDEHLNYYQKEEL